MGLCTSCEANHKPARTAKLVLQDGQLQEFPYPVRVSYLIQRYPSVIICNSDDMDFEGLVTALSEEEELQLGQLYFALPLSKLKRRLQAEEMAALAVKASEALMKSGGDKKCGRACRRNGVTPLLWGEVEVKEKADRRVVMVVGSGCGGRSRGRKRFAANLSAIPEDK